MIYVRRIMVACLASGLLVGSSLLTVQTAGAATETASTIAVKIARAGLGCEDLKATSDKILYSGKRWTCTVKGLRTNIEFYTTANLKKAGKYLCSAGIDYPLVTDARFWTVTTGDSDVDIAVAKALGVKIKKACKF